MKTCIAMFLAVGFVGTTPAFNKVSLSGISDVSGSIDAERRKKRIKGGSGCDSSHDIAEHPECR